MKICTRGFYCAFLLAFATILSQAQTFSALGASENAGNTTTQNQTVTVIAGRTVNILGYWCHDAGCTTSGTAGTDFVSLTCTGETLVQRLAPVYRTAGGSVYGVVDYTITSSVGGSETCTISTGSMFYDALIVSQASGSWTFDQCGIASGNSTNPVVTTGNSTTACTGGTGNLSASNEAILTVAVNSAQTNTVPSSYTQLNAIGMTKKDAYNGSTGTSGSTLTATWSAASDAWVAFVATFSGTGTTATYNGPGSINGVPARVEGLSSVSLTGANGVTASQTVVFCDTTSAGYSVTLPASPKTNEWHIVRNTAALNTCTINGNGRNIDKSGTKALTTGQGAMIVYDGTAWWTMADPQAGVVASPITYYICAKANGGTCVYNGDGGTVAATIADANPCTTKAAPCRTVAGALAKLSSKATFLTPVKISLANSLGTTTDCYLDTEQVVNFATLGGDLYSIWELGWGAVTGPALTDKYPTSYIEFIGDTTTPANVTWTGAATCAGTTPAAHTALRIVGTKAVVHGINFKYFDGAVQSGAVVCASYALCFVDNLTHTGAGGTGAMILMATLNSVGLLGPNLGGSETGIAWADLHSFISSHTPAGYFSTNGTITNNTYSQMMIGANEGGHVVIWGPTTQSYAGTGAYSVYWAQDQSMLEDITAGNATIGSSSLTVNAANAILLQAQGPGSVVYSSCGTSQNTCTLTAIGKHCAANAGGICVENGTNSGGSANDSVTLYGTAIYQPFSGSGTTFGHEMHTWAEFIGNTSATTPASQPGNGVIGYDSGANDFVGSTNGGGTGVIIMPGTYQGHCSGVATANTTISFYDLGNILAATCTANEGGANGFGPAATQAFGAKLLRVVAGTGGVNSSSGVVTLYDNGVATPLTCTVGTGTACVDATHLVQISGGDILTVRMTTQVGETLANVRVSFERRHQ